MASSLAPAWIGNLREKTQQAPRGGGFQILTSLIMAKTRYTPRIIRSRPSMEKGKALARSEGLLMCPEGAATYAAYQDALVVCQL